MMRGDLGQPPKGWPKKLQKKILKGEKASTDRPGASIGAVDLDATRAEIASALDVDTVNDDALNGYLMYPKVYTDYAVRHQMYGPVRTLPTKNFFYGMAPGDEISVEIDPGKTLEIRCQAIAETNSEGIAKVFFELNGQPRVVRVADRSISSEVAIRAKADVTNANHIGAPMPGVVASVAVQAGQNVKEGDLLLTIEAMKMETGIHAERDATVGAMHVSPGAQIDAKDLLLEFE